eukprot:jgi/Antlo1/328/1654
MAEPGITPEKVYRCEELALKIERVRNETNDEVRDAQLANIDSLDELMRPRDNIKRAIEFYEIFISTDRDVASGIDHLKKDTHYNGIPSLGHLDSSMFVERMVDVLCSMSRLRAYERVDIVRDFEKQHRPFIDMNIKICENAFFHSLRRYAPGFEAPHAPKFAKFLAECWDRKRFLDRYVEVFYERFRFRSSETRFGDVVARIAGHQSLFSEIERTCSALLGPVDADNATRSITEILLADTKQKVSSMLMVIEKRGRPEDVAFLLALAPIFAPPLNKFEPMFGRFRDLKEECCKMFNNLIAALYERIGSTTAPNKFCDTESFVIHTNTIVKAVRRNESLGLTFMDRCPLIASKSVRDLEVELGSKCYEKVVNVSRSITGIRRSTFMINNLYVIQNFLEEHGGEKLHDMIAECSKEIVQVWRKECEKRRGTNITGFLNTNIEVQKRYFLPDDVRAEVVEGVVDVVRSAVENSVYSITAADMFEGLSQIFSGR